MALQKLKPGINDLSGTSLLLPVQNVVIMETSGTLPVPGKCK